MQDLDHRLSELMRAAQDGDRLAYETLLTEVATTVRAFVRKRLPDVVSRRSPGGMAVELAAMSWVGGLPCIWRMLGLALAPAAMGLIMLRKAAPWRRAWAGFCAVLAACSLAMLGTQAACANDAAGHVLAWHATPVVAAALVGAVVGRRILRPSSSRSLY